MRGLIVDDVLRGSPMSFNSKRVVMGKIAMIKLVHDLGKIEFGELVRQPEGVGEWQRLHVGGRGPRRDCDQESRGQTRHRGQLGYRRR